MFSVLLVIALAVMGLCVWYNLSLRDEFAVIVGYMPPQPLPEPTSVPETDFPWVYENDESTPDYTEYESGPVTVVLVEFPLELNTATMDQLMYVPGIGSVMAQRIVQYRVEMGGYQNLEQLMEIRGIGEVSFGNIAPYFYIAGPDRLDDMEDISDMVAEGEREPE